MGASFFSGPHLLILLVVILLLFGAKRLPEIGRSLGTGMREFKDSVTAPGDNKVETRSELPPPVATPPVATPPAAAAAVATPPVATAPAPAASVAPPAAAAPATADPEREAEPVS